uniref:Uncharacterized protein n=1 Tax=Steinernema glaseri TaxID=37863 RepID=A0A1I8AQD4_9BILA
MLVSEERHRINASQTGDITQSQSSTYSSLLVVVLRSVEMRGLLVALLLFSACLTLCAAEIAGQHSRARRQWGGMGMGMMPMWGVQSSNSYSASRSVSMSNNYSAFGMGRK